MRERIIQRNDLSEEDRQHDGCTDISANVPAFMKRCRDSLFVQDFPWMRIVRTKRCGLGVVAGSDIKRNGIICDYGYVDVLVKREQNKLLLPYNRSPSIVSLCRGHIVPRVNHIEYLEELKLNSPGCVDYVCDYAFEVTDPGKYCNDD